MNTRTRSAVGIVAIAASALTACYATVDPEPVGYAQTTGAPVNIETYPSVMYGGQPAYFYGDHWWHRDGAHWTYYRNEPAELHRQRAVVMRSPRVHVGPRAEEHR